MTPTTHGQRRTQWNEFTRRGTPYLSRWGGIGQRRRLLDPTRSRPFWVEAAVIDPALTAQERARVDAAQAVHRNAQDSLALWTLSTFCLSVLALAGLSRVLPDDIGSTWLIALGLTVLVAPAALVWVSLGRRYRRAARIPSDLQEHVLANTDADVHDGDAVIAAALQLGNLENTSGTTDDEVNAVWGATWRALASARQEDRDWAAAPTGTVRADTAS